MAELGSFALLLGLFLSIYAILVDALGDWRKDNALIKSGRNATIACAICISISGVLLWLLLVRGDFAVSYVAENVSRALPFVYKLSAFWAGASGSLLFWLWLQVIFVALVFCKFKENPSPFSIFARITANIISVFFLIILIMDKNPFGLSAVAPSDGAGLNPLLQHPAMALHPPTLFIGYAALIIPLAGAFTYLQSNSLLDSSSQIFRQIRNWVLFGWLFLTIGIVLGAWWAYEELGWGGYWAWDPVENASLMPWLTATALLHCCRTYRSGNSVVKWLILLSLVTFSLCIFGTFLTRYGLVSSVHAFPEPGLGIMFLFLLIVLWVLAALLWWRQWTYKKLDSVPTETAGAKVIAVNNWLMVLLTFVILIGTIFPFISGLFSQQKISLKSDYFTRITAPGGIAILLLLSLCPQFIKSTMSRNWRVVVAAILAIVALVTWIITNRLALIFFIVCGFALLILITDFINRHKKAGAGKNMQRWSPFSLRWYGARIAHLGVIMVFIGIAGSGGYDVEEQAALKPGQKINIAGFDILFSNLREGSGPNFTSEIADIKVSKREMFISDLHPSQLFYNTGSQKRISRVDIRRTLGYDLYIALTEVDTARNLVNLRVLIKPLINWIWIGGFVMVLGAAFAWFSPYKQKTVAINGDEGAK